MAERIANRPAETQAVADLLTRARHGPAGLVVEGAAGIGKTTLLLDAIGQAQDQGFRVLSAHGSPVEASYAYAAVADLMREVDVTAFAELPTLLRLALDRACVGGSSGEGPATDERTVATAFLSVVERISAKDPILLVVDDIQWLDASSRAVIGFCGRRLTGPIGMMLSLRTDDPDAADLRSWLHFRNPETLAGVCMRPLSLGDTHAIVTARLGHPLPRPTITRIHEVSGGNPLFAIELASAVGSVPAGTRGLPDSLAALVRRKIGEIGEETAEVLLAAACIEAPTLESVSRAAGMPADDVVTLLGSVESRGVIALDGHHLRFNHPMYATGVYTAASPARRRSMHRRLASVVDQIEVRARHLALAATASDAATLSALDAAAEASARRGAFAAAAELSELAIRLGDDTPQRRVRAAEHHFRSGSLRAARELLQPAIDNLPPGAVRCAALLLLGAVLGYSDDTAAAVQAFVQAVDQADDDTELRLYALLRLVAATVMTGRIDHAVEYARIAVALAERLGIPELRSRALSIWVTVTFVHGQGVDRQSLLTALELEDPHGGATTWYQASAVQAMICAWTGDLSEAHNRMSAVRHRMLNSGNEFEIIWAANHIAAINVWLGRYPDAAEASRDAVERAEQMGGRHLLVTAWGWQAAVAAYQGREADARSAASAAIDAANEIGAPYLADAPTATLAFVEVSTGDYGAAIEVLEPLLTRFDPAQGTEIMTGGHLPDAIEALVGLGRVEQADRLITALQENGTRLSRSWMLAVAARGRALFLAAVNDLPGAEEAAVGAMTHHQTLSMPFETARTQLLLGQVQRRRRRRQEATTSLRAALQTFDRLGAPLWASRARSELTRLDSARGDGQSLTAAEARVAELAATGKSNKQIAAELFVSAKTVEMNLSRVYRKLGIRSRGGLSAALRQGDVRNDDPARDRMPNLG